MMIGDAQIDARAREAGLEPPARRLVDSADPRARPAARLAELIDRHGIRLIAVGNGTGGRETMAFRRSFPAARAPSAPPQPAMPSGPD